MITQPTRAIILRTVKYGETSVVVTAYTSLFGLQSYLIKGALKGSTVKPVVNQYFQPGAILEMVVYQNPSRSLQLVKEYGWHTMHQQLFFDVVRNSVAVFMIDVLLHSVRQPEANPELYELMEMSLKQADRATMGVVANLPIYFILHLSSELGFQIQGTYSRETPVLDLKEGSFLHTIPSHPFYLDGEPAKHLCAIRDVAFYESLDQVALQRNTRQVLLHHLQQYMALHIQDFGTLKTLYVLSQVL